ncbi:MAG: inner membrane-spanning protein YciB [Chromatiales bacterium]
MALLIDFFPLIVFYAAYNIPVAGMQPIFVATAAAIPASIVQVLWYRVKFGHYKKMHLFIMAMIVLLGGATLVLQDKRFIMFKPTVVNWLLALIVIGSHFLRKPVLQFLLAEMKGAASLGSLPPPVVIKVNLLFGLSFFVVGAINLYVALSYAESVWVKFRTFGIPLLDMLLMLPLVFYLAHEMREVENEQKG